MMRLRYTSTRYERDIFLVIHSRMDIVTKLYFILYIGIVECTEYRTHDG